MLNATCQIYIKLITSRIFLIKPHMQVYTIPHFPLPPSPLSQPHSLPLLCPQAREECLALLAKIDILEKRLSHLERRLQEPTDKQKQRKKNRRKNEQLSKRFRCLREDCHRVYDSVTSLKYHMRVKHEMRVKKKRLQDVLFEVAPHK